MIAERRPDLVLIGRESFAWHVPGIAASHSLPCLLRAAGATTVGILERTYPPSLAGPLLAQYRRTDLVITPSEYIARELRRLGVQNVKAVLNAIDLRRFRPGPKNPRLMKELAIDEDAIVIAYAGNLNERKRPLDVVHSSVEVLKRCPAVVYLVVGEGTEWRRTVQAARELRVDHRFRWVGWQAYEDMPEYINLSDIVVSPSFGEGLARVYLEAQACGRVLIASDIPPAREVVRNGESGLLFPVGDVDGLSARCIEAARDPGLRARIGRAALERVQHHDIGTAVERYLGEFRAIARRPDPVRPPPAEFSAG
jgi:glycosyltransferase involved in cell wall biosynthesis